MQQQHLMQMQPMNVMAAYYPNSVTSDHIQQYLDENKSLILKIVESQNAGKINECQENQARLQRNLMYLAAIADSQPPPTALHSQLASGGMMQPGGSHYMQHQQSMMYTQQQYAALQQQQALHSQLGLHVLQSEASASLGGYPDYGTALAVGSKQDLAGQGSTDAAETLYLKSTDDNGN